MNAPAWKQVAAAGAVLALGAAASVYVARVLRRRGNGGRSGDGARRGPTAGRPLTLVRGGAGEG
ncbi:MAG TPA: hypothetical protein VFJ16_03585 [Longimicrobium sp.]|nr:hypothetical protein [Longimicrobium sp.]